MNYLGVYEIYIVNKNERERMYNIKYHNKCVI